MHQILIYTDLDSTLLDAKTGGFEPAQGMLRQLNEMKIPWMLNSSRTIAELLSLRKKMGNCHPFAGEHGGVVCVPQGYYSSPLEIPLDHEVKVDYLGLNYKAILYELVELKDVYNFSFVGVDDISAARLAAQADLPLETAKAVKQRLASEAVLWMDDQNALAHFESRLGERGLCLTKGGRFYFVTSHRADKGRAVDWLNFNFHEAVPNRCHKTIGIGDGHNDLSLLRQVDLAVVVKPPRGQVLDLGDNAIYTQNSGPLGWAEGVKVALAQWGL